MTFGFRALPDLGHNTVRPRPIVDSYEWSAVVRFCEPWTPAFGLLGLTGFFDQFEVTIAAYQERIELLPIDRRA